MIVHLTEGGPPTTHPDPRSHRPGVGSGNGRLPSSVKAEIFARGMNPQEWHKHAAAIEAELDSQHQNDPNWETNVDDVQKVMQTFPMIHTSVADTIPLIEQNGLVPAHEVGKGYAFDKISGLDKTVFMRQGQAGGGGQGAVGVIIDPAKLNKNNFIVTRLGAMDLKAQEEGLLASPGDHSLLVDEQLKPYRNSTIGIEDMPKVQARLLVNGYLKTHPDQVGKLLNPADVISNDYGVMEVKYVGHIPKSAILTYFAGKSTYDHLVALGIPPSRLTRYEGDDKVALSHAYRKYYSAIPLDE